MIDKIITLISTISFVLSFILVAIICAAAPAALFTYHYNGVIPPEHHGTLVALIALGNVTGIAGIFGYLWVMDSIGKLINK